VCAVQEKRINLDGREHDLLLFDWLSELLYVFETEHLLLTQFDVRLDETGLHAICRGEPADRSRHELDHEVKAITYHGLLVRREPDGWLAEVIVDI
jgi:SHS2 domain-containing protein